MNKVQQKLNNLVDSTSIETAKSLLKEYLLNVAPEVEDYKNDFPKIVTTGVFASKRSLICGSSSTAEDALRVDPKAAIFACLRERSEAFSKKAISLGLLPGQPPSI